MLISAFKMRYLRITELTELTGHVTWPYPDNLVIQEKKKKKKNKKKLDKTQKLSACELKS